MFGREDVTERVRSFVAEVCGVGELADAEGVANDHDRARFGHLPQFIAYRI
jgi:hypothetical protein